MKYLFTILLLIVSMTATAGPAATKVQGVLDAINGAPVPQAMALKIIDSNLIAYRSWLPDVIKAQEVCEADTVDEQGATVAGECRTVALVVPTDPSTLTTEEKAQFFLDCLRQRVRADYASVRDALNAAAEQAKAEAAVAAKATTDVVLE